MNDKKLPMISFILTYYNQPVKMLQECIESIIALSLRPYEREIIIVDDGSDLSPINELLKYGKDIIYIRQKNQGPGLARNTGIHMATADYLQFVDGDDFFNQAAYEHCLDIMRYNQPDMVIFDMASRATRGSTFIDEGPMTGSEYMRSHNIHGTACGYIFRRNMLGALRFSSLIYCEDEEFTPQLISHAERVFITNAKAYVYRKNTGSITHKKGKRSTIKMLSDNLQAIRSLQTVSKTLQQKGQEAMQRRIAQLTMAYIYNIILQTRSRHYLDRKLNILRRDGLFPLPDRNYTTKYKWFRRLLNSDFGIKLLMFAIPLLPKER